MKLNTDEFLDEFIDEVTMYLEDLESSILNLESDPGDKECLNNIFRIAHSIKGIGAMMGFSKLERLTHNMEDVLYDVRDNKADVDREVIEMLFICNDFLNNILIDISETGTEENVNEKEIDKIIKKLHKITEHKVMGYKANNKTVEVYKGLKITKDKAKSIKDKVKSDDYSIYYIKVEFDKKTVMKKVRGYMVINYLTKEDDILKSEPSVSQLRDDDFNMENNAMNILLNTNQTKTDVRKIIEGVPEVIDTEIKKVDNIKEIIECEEEEIDKFIQEELIGEHEVDRNVQDTNEVIKDPDFLNFIEKKLLKIKRFLLKIEDSSDNFYLIMEFYDDIKQINSRALTMKADLIENLTQVMLNVINMYKEEDLDLESKLIDFLLEMIDLGLKWTKRPDINKKKNFMNEIKRVITKMEDYMLEREVKPEDRVGEILKKISQLSDTDIANIEELQKKNPNKKFAELVVDNDLASEEDAIRAIRLQKTKQRKKRKSLKLKNYIRVDSQKADELVSNVGELKIMQTQLEHLLLKYSKEVGKRGRAAHGDRKKIIRMQRIMKKIQHISMSFRLIPLRSTFQKVNRTVRDTLKKVNKNVNFEMQGEETEIDKEIADKLLKLIIHLVKNSISHGIEDTKTRKKLGKPEIGNVKLFANQSKGFIDIKISDDGAGIDPDKIYKSAKKKGLIKKNKKYTEEEKINLIFLPGFSTAKEVGKISGRGVGMDVVKTDIEKMGGKINIDTEIDKGSTFEMKIPINMSIVEGTIIKISGETYIMPNIYIREVTRISKDLWVDVKGKRNTIKIREQIIPVIDLQNIFNHKVDEKDAKMFMILDVEGRSKAILVDEILERREVVEKPLGEEFKHLEYVSGASILGDGKVSLILNAKKL